MNMRWTSVVAAAAVVACGVVGATALGDPTTRPTDAATVTREQSAANLRKIGQAIILYQKQATTMPAETAESLLNKVDAAYADLKSAEFDGTITTHLDVSGRKVDGETPFKSSFAAPNKFRHESVKEILVVSDGQNVSSLLMERSEYQTAPAPKERKGTADWPGVFIKLLGDKNPSLLLAIGKSASAELKELSKDVTPGQPVTIGGAVCPTLVFKTPVEQPQVVMAFDPVTNLVRQVRMDYVEAEKKAGAADVKTAEVVIDYTRVAANPGADDERFAFAPPAGAALVSSSGEAAIAAGGDYKQLIGKPAPDFTLNDVDDKPVKMSSLKGSVVVLDFWATWCGPCRASMPHLNDLYAEKKDAGLKVFAVDLQEDKETVTKLTAKMKWSLPVLFDTDGKVSKSYGVSGIPHTAVIGKDGVLKKVFIGSGNEDNIRAAVVKEMGQ